MRFMLTRSLLLTIAVFAWAMPVFAATTHPIPYGVVAGAPVTFLPSVQNADPFPVTFPINEIVVAESCVVILDYEIVSGALEINMQAAGSSTACNVGARVYFQMEVTLPEITDGTSIAVYLVPVELDNTIVTSNMGDSYADSTWRVEATGRQARVSSDTLGPDYPFDMPNFKSINSWGFQPPPRVQVVRGRSATAHPGRSLGD